MDLDLDDELLAFQHSVRRLCEDRFGADAARRAGGPDGLDRSSWSELARVGVLAPADLGAVASTVAFEELGRSLVAGPLVATAVAAALLPSASEGTRIVTAVTGPPGVHLVEHLASADDLLRLAPDGVWMVPADEVIGVVVEPLDPTATVTRAEVPQGLLLAGPEVAVRLDLLASLLSSALLVGSSAATTELAVAYAKERTQFGRPIGSFQAVKHLLADAYARTEVARASLHAAAVTTDDPSTGDLERAVAGARVLATAAGVTNGRTALQVFGGMGFTWEVDVHLHLKRCWTLASAFGTASGAAEVVTDRLLAAR